MAHKKGVGSSRNGRDSNSQRLGVKAHDGNLVSGGTIKSVALGDEYTVNVDTLRGGAGLFSGVISSSGLLGSVKISG